jgi:hypothetical protein
MSNPSKCNSDRWEAAHKKFVTEMYKHCSGRGAKLHEEMLRKVIDSDWSDHRAHITGILLQSIGYLKHLLPKSAPAKGIFRRLHGNAVHWKLDYDVTNPYKFTTAKVIISSKVLYIVLSNHFDYLGRVNQGYTAPAITDNSHKIS